MLARRTKRTIVFVRAKKCFRNFKRSETGSQVFFFASNNRFQYFQKPPIFPSSINNNKKERGRKKKPFSQESTHGNKQRGNITLHLSTLRYYSEPPSRLANVISFPLGAPLSSRFLPNSLLLNRSFTSKKGSNYSRPEILLAFDKNSLSSSNSNVIPNDAEFCSNFNFLILRIPTTSIKRSVEFAHFHSTNNWRGRKTCTKNLRMAKLLFSIRSRLGWLVKSRPPSFS